jgi:hypothetical protein
VSCCTAGYGQLGLIDSWRNVTSPGAQRHPLCARQTARHAASQRLPKSVFLVDCRLQTLSHLFHFRFFLAEAFKVFILLLTDIICRPYHQLLQSCRRSRGHLGSGERVNEKKLSVSHQVAELKKGEHMACMILILSSPHVGMYVFPCNRNQSIGYQQADSTRTAQNISHTSAHPTRCDPHLTTMRCDLTIVGSGEPCKNGRAVSISNWLDERLRNPHLATPPLRFGSRLPTSTLDSRGASSEVHYTFSSGRSASKSATVRSDTTRKRQDSAMEEKSVEEFPRNGAIRKEINDRRHNSECCNSSSKHSEVIFFRTFCASSCL